MITFLTALLLIAALLASGEAFIRLLLVIRSRHGRNSDGGAVGRWLVLVPARAEGESVRKTLASLANVPGRVVLLLDGDDVEASRIARELGVDVVTKEPPGPTKGAALGWLAKHHREAVTSSDAVLLVDVGSILGERFFEECRWPVDAGALQAILAGEGKGTGAAAASSERFAQNREDAGREAIGWSVRLRGTGTALKPSVFLDVVPRLVTQVEDLEASLLIVGAGVRARLSNARVHDDKPSTIQSAAMQRARWLLGRYSLLWRHPRAIGQALRRAPLEAVAFLFEIFGRPLSLTIPLRIIAGLLAIFFIPFGAISVALAAVVLISAVLDFSIFVFAARTSPGSALRLVAAWAAALLLLPRAMFRWMRVKRR